MTRYEFLWTAVIAPLAALFGVSVDDEEPAQPENWTAHTNSRGLMADSGGLKLTTSSPNGTLYVDTTNGDQLTFANTSTV